MIALFLRRNSSHTLPALFTRCLVSTVRTLTCSLNEGLATTGTVARIIFLRGIVCVVLDVVPSVVVDCKRKCSRIRLCIRTAAVVIVDVSIVVLSVVVEAEVCTVVLVFAVLVVEGVVGERIVLVVVVSAVVVILSLCAVGSIAACVHRTLTVFTVLVDVAFGVSAVVVILLSCTVVSTAACVHGIFTIFPIVADVAFGVSVVVVILMLCAVVFTAACVHGICTVFVVVVDVAVVSLVIVLAVGRVCFVVSTAICVHIILSPPSDSFVTKVSFVVAGFASSVDGMNTCEVFASGAS